MGGGGGVYRGVVVSLLSPLLPLPFLPHPSPPFLTSQAPSLSRTPPPPITPSLVCLQYYVGPRKSPWHFHQVSLSRITRKWTLVLDGMINEPLHDKTNKMTCAPSKDSDQPGHPPSLPPSPPPFLPRRMLRLI